MNSLKVALFITVKSIVRGNIGVTLLTIIMLVLANLNLLFVPSLINGIVYTANNKLIDTYSSNILVESDGDSPYIRRIDRLIPRIEAINGVVAVTYRNRIGAELEFEEESTSGIITGIPPVRDSEVFSIVEAIIEGGYLDSRDTGKILLGLQKAGAGREEIELYSSSLRRVHAGDEITVTYTNGVRKKYEVAGIFHTEFVQSDLQIFITEREFRSIKPLTDNRATVIHVKINSDNDNDNEVQRIITEIGELEDDLAFQTWKDTAGLMRSMTGSFAVIKGILAAVNILVAGITVFIITYVDLVNKRRQIGISRAIGITPLAITISYLLRAVFYALLAVVASWFLYVYVVIPIEARYPFHFPFGSIILFIDNPLLVRSGLIILGVAIVAALLPVQRTIRIKLLDAIWG